MATRTIFNSLRRAVSSNGARSQSMQISNENGRFSKLYSADAVSGECVEESPNLEKDDLRSRIFRLRLPKRSATTVLERWTGEGNRIMASELRQISRELRKSQRYKHALEISEWMVQHKESEMSDADYADRIVLISKVFGVDAAERYFESLPHVAKTSETYTALLHSFAGSKQTERAEDLFEQIKNSKDLSFGTITYNEMMTMYISVGQVEKVPGVIEELKRRDIAPDIFTYNLWISSCAATLNMDDVKRVLDQMRSNSNSSDNWVRYINLANIYVNSGRLVNSELGSGMDTEKGISQREWITYDFLVILYASLGNKDRIDQIWKSLRMTKQKMTSRNYVCAISSYLILGHLREVGDVLDQWKQSATAEFDSSACQRILGAFRDVGLTERADDFRMVLVQRNCDAGNEEDRD